MKPYCKMQNLATYTFKERVK